MAFFNKHLQAFPFIFLLFTLFVSCKSKINNQSKEAIFHYNESAGITSLDPAFAKDQANIWAVNQLFNGLVQLDEQLKVKPCIAKSWTIDKTGTLYSFILRNDVRFHDHKLFKNAKGRRVVASDFVYSFKRLRNDNIASPGAWVFNNVIDGDSGFVAVNDTVINIKLKNSFPPFLSLLSMQYCSVVPREIADFYGKDFGRNPVGTGPFMFKYWKDGAKLIFRKNPNYFEFENGNRLPFLDGVAISFIIDKQSAFLEFVKGNIDLISGIDASYKDELLTPAGRLNPAYADKINMVGQPYLNTEYLGFLVEPGAEAIANSPLKDKRIRQAINYGFDRQKMIRYLRNNIGTAASSGMVPLGLPSFDADKVVGYTYNPDKARRLLKEAGYPNGKGLPTIKLSVSASYLDICKYIQQQLSEIGIDLEVDVNPPGALREMIANTKLAFFRGSWIADYPDAENYLSLFYSKNKAPKGPNYTHFSNAEFDRLYESSQLEVNDEKRYVLYRQMDQMLMDEAVVVVLYYDEVLRFSRKNIKNLGSNPLNLLELKRVKKG